ncbi:MAG: hypothetical protein ACREDJ_08865, partial [Methylocella sp.]
MFAQGESLIRGFTTDTILVERPQIDTNRVALIQRWCMDRRTVAGVACAAFQAIAEHARGDRADDEGGAGLSENPRHPADNRHLSHYWRFYGAMSRAMRKNG